LFKTVSDMKSVLGVLGLSGLVLSCSGTGDAVFEPVGGENTGAAAGKSSSGGGGGGSGGSGGAGGGSSTAGSGGKGMGGSNGGTGGRGMSGSAGSDPVGGGGSGPGTPEVIFVTTEGADDAQCGLTPITACQTISHGSARALEAGRADVYVQAGTYVEVAVLKPGVRVLGGFNSEWENGARTDDAYQVVIQGLAHEDTGEYVAVWAHDLESEATLENLLIVGPNAEGQRAGTSDGRSSYGVHAVSAKLALKDVDITAGNGAEGAEGTAGLDAAMTLATDAMNGKVGGNGLSANHLELCNTTVAEGGNPGTNSCAAGPSTTLMSGGKGGSGGARDGKCTGNSAYVAAAGGPGIDAATTAGTSGKGGAAGTGGAKNQDGCGVTTSGASGAVTNGVAGQATGGGYVADGFWYASPGGDGGTGENGGGGGGGGGAGGCDTDDDEPWAADSRGAAGGGGGAGGCAAHGGGKGGGGGGGSFGIFAIGSTLNLEGVAITRGAGGAGGAGGSGGQGQSGGLGNSGGTRYTPSATPGKGGNGGHGGHGGGGAGGSGGRSLGVVLSASSTLVGEPSISGGAAGPGGEGGVSAPAAPESERDGNDGQDGAEGTVGETLDCAAETSC
jgi:hypothetical protein